MAERMLKIRIPFGQLGSGHRDHRRQHIGQIVQGIHQDGDGVGTEPYHGLESSQQEIDHDPDETGLQDDGFPPSI